MESRGGRESVDRNSRRLAIARRSCDQCRTRKIGCDRGSPCSSCVFAKLDCTHSAPAPTTSTPKQRVLISAQYERKIDEIAESVDGIKVLLQRLNLPADLRQFEGTPVQRTSHLASVKTPSTSESDSNHAAARETAWKHSTHIIDFVKAILQDRGTLEVEPEEAKVLASLRNLVQLLERPAAVRGTSELAVNPAKHAGDQPMPPLEAALNVLRWAKDNASTNYGLLWVDRILPLQRFADICQKVYFAVDDFTEIDFVLANGHLFSIFTEFAIASGSKDYRDYCRMCQGNFYNALARLPLLLPASMEVVAALTLGAFHAVEDSKAAVGWTLISTASDLCQTLGYHRLRPTSEHEQPTRAIEERLFWAIHRIEKGLSLRLGRSSNIRDIDITLPADPDEPRFTKAARIQGRCYDQLYSPAGLTRPEEDRGLIAEILARDMRHLVKEARSEVRGVLTQPATSEADTMRIICMQCDLVCQLSLLVLVLRAIPVTRGLPSNVSDECIAVARETFDVHQECVSMMRKNGIDPFAVRKYLTWAILHVPFVPFSILFTRAVQLPDASDLDRLDRFAASLRFEDEASPESMAYPHRLYELLCQAARIYTKSSRTFENSRNNAKYSMPGYSEEYNDLENFEMDTGMQSEDFFADGIPQPFELSDWIHGNQQMMSLLHEDVTF